MDKSWMNIAHRTSDPRYELGVNEFLDFAYRNKQVSSKVPCPCKDCNNYRKHSRATILDHLMKRGITVGYENWVHHGEPYDDLDDSDDDMAISEGSDGDNDMDDDDDDLGEMLNNIGESRGGVNWQSDGESSSTFNKDVETLRLLLAESGKGVSKRVGFHNSSSSQEVSKAYNSSKSRIVPQPYKLSSSHEVLKPYKLSKSQDVSLPHKPDVPRKRLSYTRLEDEEVQSQPNIPRKRQAYTRLEDEEVQTQPNIPRKRLSYTRLEDEEVQEDVQSQPNIPRKRQAYMRLEDEEVQEEVQTQPNIPRKRQAYMRFEDEEVQEKVQTESGDHEDYSEDDHEVNSVQTETDIGSTSHGTSVTRKESRALNEAKKRRLDKGKLVFEIDECAGRIIGKDSQRFITMGGCLVREYAIFDGTTWKKQPDFLKMDIITKYVENSTFNRKCERSVRAIHSQLGNQHKNWQYKLHVKYKEFPTHEEAMEDPPSDIELSDWVKLCQKFVSEEFQKLSAQNKKNRSFNLIPPAVGTKSVAIIIDTRRREGKEVTAIDGFQIAHYCEKKKNG